nr:MAG TPA: hypothetical protein [Caudoviricetes sp.]
MSTIIKDTLHPENESGTDIYPKTSNDQVVGYGQNLEGKDYALVDETCKKPTNLGTPTHVLGVDSPSSNQPINIPIGFGAGNIPKRNGTYNLENLYDATKPNELIRKSQFDKGLAEVSTPVVNITATSTAIQGTISSADLAVLQGNKSAIIRFNNELYYFMDDEYKSGYLTYSHVGIDTGVQWVKSITITISSLSWVLTKAQVAAGVDIYCHELTFYKSLTEQNEGYKLTVYSLDKEAYTSNRYVSNYNYIISYRFQLLHTGGLTLQFYGNDVLDLGALVNNQYSNAIPYLYYVNKSASPTIFSEDVSKYLFSGDVITKVIKGLI